MCNYLWLGTGLLFLCALLAIVNYMDYSLLLACPSDMWVVGMTTHHVGGGSENFIPAYFSIKYTTGSPTGCTTKCNFNKCSTTDFNGGLPLGIIYSYNALKGGTVNKCHRKMVIVQLTFFCILEFSKSLKRSITSNIPHNKKTRQLNKIVPLTKNSNSLTSMPSIIIIAT